MVPPKRDCGGGGDRRVATEKDPLHYAQKWSDPRKWLKRLKTFGVKGRVEPGSNTHITQWCKRL